MVFVFPWWQAYNHTAILVVSGKVDSAIQLGYADAEASVPFRLVADNGGFFLAYRAELPPRRTYDLELVFPEGSGGHFAIHDITLARNWPSNRSIHYEMQSLGGRVEPGLEALPTLEGVRILAEPGATLSLPFTVPGLTPLQWLIEGVKATVGYLALSSIILVLLATLIRFPDRLTASRREPRLIEVILIMAAGLIGGAIHLHLVHHSVPVFHPEQSFPDPGPGYGWIFSRMFEILAWDLNAWTLVQGAVFCFSVLAAALAMSPFLKGYALAIAVGLALVSPAAVWASRHVGPESLQASSWLLSIGAFIWMWQSQGWRRILLTILSGVLMAYAALLTASGLIMLVSPLALATGALAWSWSVRKWQCFKVRVLWRTVGQFGLVALCVLPAASWISFPKGVLQTDHSVVELQNDLAERGRLAVWAVWMPDVQLPDGQHLLRSFEVLPAYDSPEAAAEAVDALRELSVWTGRDITLKERQSDVAIFIYNELMAIFYPWIYRLLFVVAVLVWLAAYRKRKFLCGVLILPFLINVVLAVLHGDLSSTAVQTLDAFLWFSSAIGLAALFPDSLQQAPSLDDRRCSVLHRPKRLFSPYRVPNKKLEH